MRSRVQRSATVPCVWVLQEIRIGPTLIEQGREMGVKLSSEKVPVSRFALEPGSQIRSEFACRVWRLEIGKLVSAAAPDRKTAQLRDSLQ